MLRSKKQRRGRDFWTLSEMLVMCLHEETTSVTLPERQLGKARSRYLKQYDRLMNDIASAAPQVQSLCLGKTLPKLLNTEPDAIVKFTKQLAPLHGLKTLDATHFKCTTTQLELIISNAPNLR